jgi:hypothetical protein
MSFLITFLPEDIPNLKAGEKASYGIIQIGKFEERFVASLNFWGKDDYYKQWKQAIKRLTDQKSQRSCLITSLTNPKTANFITWWPIYRVGNSVYFQNQILFMSKLDTPFNPDDPYKYVSPRKTITEDKVEISEWELQVSDLRLP